MSPAPKDPHPELAPDRVVEESRAAGEPEWLADLRREALLRFAATPQGFGRYSRLRLNWQGLPLKRPQSPAAPAPWDLAELRPAVDRSTPLRQDLSADGGSLARALLKPVSPWDDLVLAGWREGICIRPAGEGVAYLPLGDDEGLVLEPILLDVPPRSEASLFVHWRGSRDEALRLTALRVRVGEGSRLRLFQLHDGMNARHHESALFLVGRDASVESFSAWLGGDWAVFRSAAELGGPGSSWKESHLVVGTGKQHLDVDTQVRHAEHHTRSDVQVKAVAADSARAVFTGNICMEPRARGGEAYLSDHTLLLSPEARADSVPGLEIKAQDVKAAHAASAGQLDEQQMFYLMSRGLDPSRARHLIVVGFLESLFDRAPFAFVPQILDPALESKVLA